MIALLRADLVEPDLRRNAIESLEDFLKGSKSDCSLNVIYSKFDHKLTLSLWPILDTTAFVDEVFNVLQTKSYQPGRNASRAESSTASSLTLASAPSGAYGSLGAGRDLHGGLLESRKRSYNDRQADGEGIDRQMKQTRRGGRASRADSFGGRNTKGGFQETNHPYARPPPVPPAFPNMQLPPPFDPSDPLAAMIAMQAMGLPPLPGMPPLSQVGSPNGYSQLGGQSLSPSRRRTSKERCRDYDDKGYCARGNACPYEHGTDRLIVPGQDGEKLTSPNWAKLMPSRIRPQEF